MDGWTVTYDVAHGATPIDDVDYDTAIEDLTERVAPHGGVIAVAPDRHRYSVTLSIEDVVHVQAALEVALALAAEFAAKAGLPVEPIVNVHVRTWAELDAEISSR